VALVVELLNDQIHELDHLDKSGNHINLMLELVESIVATSIKLRSFSHLASQ
jgi:hypothetical protein